MLYDIYYKALTWSQEISTSQGEATTLLRLKCVPKANCELKLSTGGKLRDYEISMGIAPGEPLAEQLQGRNLQTDAVGVVFEKGKHCTWLVCPSSACVSEAKSSFR
jgi:hypothetical protein